MIIAATGHRPEKLGGYGRDVEQRLRDLAVWFLMCTRPTVVISGVALGWDTAIAEAALTLRIPLWAAVPFAGQESRWAPRSQAIYRGLLQQAERVVIVSEGGFSSAAMQRRNEWMVDECAALVALWDGSAGGTANCLKYANKIGRPGWNLWQYWR